MQALKTVKKAREAALRGETGPALEALRDFASKGDDSAAASFAELAAFRGDWSGVIPHAGRLAANPGAVYAGNVFDDMIRLLGRAGHETSRWDLVGKAAESARQSVEKSAGAENARVRALRILDGLKAYAGRRGAAPHELVAVFGEPGGPKREPHKEEAAYRDAVDNAHVHRPDLKGKPDKLARHHFALAVTFGREDDAIRVYGEHAAKPSFAFDAAAHVAKLLARRGKPDEAWQAVSAKLPMWWPVDQAQVAPVVLLVDEDLRAIMSPERREAVLATPRGTAAQKR